MAMARRRRPARTGAPIKLLGRQCFLVGQSACNNAKPSNSQAPTCSVRSSVCICMMCSLSVSGTQRLFFQANPFRRRLVNPFASFMSALSYFGNVKSGCLHATSGGEILLAKLSARIRCFTFSLAMVVPEYFSQHRQLVNRHASCLARVFGKKMIVGKRIETRTNNKLNRVLDRTVSWRKLNRQYGNNPD